jgi:hypothetical protein
MMGLSKQVQARFPEDKSRYELGKVIPNMEIAGGI